MTIKNFTFKRYDAVVSTLITLAVSISSCFAQDAYIDVDIKAPKPFINLAAGLNFSAMAHPLTINSPFSELKPTIALNGTRLYFSRANHPGNVGGMEDNEDIWYADVDKANNNALGEGKRLPGILNNSGPNFINGVSVTGDTILLGNRYLKNGKMKSGQSISVRKDSVWSSPIAINIKNDYNLSEHGNAYMSLTAGVVILAIERAETHGGRDLYVSFIHGTDATEPINLGNVINTHDEETSAFLSHDRKTLYFASKGHHGYGGLDIFMSKRLDETWTKWSKPENLGPVVNGPMDEEFFLVTHCKKFAYFSRQVSEGNTDIYKVTMAELFGGYNALFR